MYYLKRVTDVLVHNLFKIHVMFNIYFIYFIFLIAG